MKGLVGSCWRKPYRLRSRCRLMLESLEGRLVPSTGPLDPAVTDDVPANSFAMISLDGAGAAMRKGTIDYAGDSDLFAFVSAVTGQTTIKVDGGVIPEQTISVLVAAGQTYAFSVFAD